MADEKISDLPVAAALDGSELLPVVQGGVTVQTTAQDVADLGGGGASVLSVASVGSDLGNGAANPLTPSTFTIPAGSLGVGKAVKFHGLYNVYNNSAGGVDETMTLAVLVGGNTMFSTPCQLEGATFPYAGRAMVVDLVITADADGNAIASGIISVATVNAPTSDGSIRMGFTNPDPGSPHLATVGCINFTVDPDIDNVFDFNVSFANPDVGRAVSRYHHVAEAI